MLKTELEKLEDIKINLNEDNVLLEEQKKKVGDKFQMKVSDKQSSQKRIEELESNLKKEQEYE